MVYYYKSKLDNEIKTLETVKSCFSNRKKMNYMVSTENQYFQFLVKKNITRFTVGFVRVGLFLVKIKREYFFIKE